MSGMTVAKTKTCVRKGCGSNYDDDANDESACTFHSGPRLKGWSCCSKRVCTFDEFLAIPGCTTGAHTDIVDAPSPAPQPKLTEKPTAKRGDVEAYGSVAPRPSQPQAPVAKKPAAKPVSPQLDDFDPDGVSIGVGSVCKRNGCGYAFKSSDVSCGDGAEAACAFHFGSPVFHEGSKGWSCCSRKVLEFDEFLRIKGCRTGKHLFVGGGAAAVKAAEALLVPVPAATYRHDWFQSPTHVTVSIYAKKVDPASAVVRFENQRMYVEFPKPDGDIFKMDTALFQPVDPAACSFRILGTKIEISLKKANSISWASLEPTETVTSWTTFGTTGGVGTVGGKEMVIAQDAPLMALNR